MPKKDKSEVGSSSKQSKMILNHFIISGFRVMADPYMSAVPKSL